MTPLALLGQSIPVAQLARQATSINFRSNRITSYNVCYTKLLRKGKARLFLPSHQIAHNFAQFETRSGVNLALDFLAALGPVATGDAPPTSRGKHFKKLFQLSIVQQRPDAAAIIV